jgi:hypothetical protein
MTLKAMIEEHVSTVFLNTDDFAETIKRRVEDGRSNRTTSLVAVVTWDPPVSNSGEGKREANLRGTIAVPSGLNPPLKMSDRWIIGETTYATLAVHPPQYGMQNVLIEQRVGDMRGGSLGVI